MAKKKKTSSKNRNKENNKVEGKVKKPVKSTTKPSKTAKKTEYKPAKAPSLDFFEEKLGANSMYLALGLLCMIAFVVYGTFFFTDNVMFFKDIGSDTINGLYPLYYGNAEIWESEGSLSMWSFSSGLGQNNILQNVGDPFVWLLYIAGKDSILGGIAYIEALKILLAGMCFYAYLRTMSMTYLASTVGGLVYAFSGFMMVGSGWFLFTIEGLYFALLLLAFERFLLLGKWGLFPVVIMLVAMFQPFDVYIMAVMVATYGTVRVLDVNDFDWLDLGKKHFQLAFLGVLGLVMGGVLLLPSLELMLNSPRVLGESSFYDTLASQSIFEITDTNLWTTTKARLFSTNLLVDNTFAFKGRLNYLEAPAIYCGLGTLILIPQAFVFLSNKKRILYGSLLGLFLLPLLFPFLRYSFWLYSGNYFRFYSLFVVFILLYLAVRAIHDIYTEDRISWIAFGIGVLGAFFLLFTVTNSADNVVVVNESAKTAAMLLLAVNAIVIAGWSMKALRPMARIAFLVLLCIDLMSVARPTLNNRGLSTASEFTTDKVGYNDYTVDAIRDIKSRDTSFHRTEKHYASGLAMHSSSNDAKVQGYMGTRSYNSFNQLNYIRFLGALDVINQADENQTRWSPGVGSRQLLSMLVSNKYVLTKTGPEKPVGLGYKYLTIFNDVSVFENQYFLPLGFTYDKMILRSDFDKIKKDNISKDITLMKAVVIEDHNVAVSSKLVKFDTTPINPQLYQEFAMAADVKERKEEAFELETFKNSHLTGKITVSKDKMLFFSIPLDKGWTAIVNGEKAKIHQVNVGFSGLMLPKGTHEIELIYNTPYLSTGMWVSLLGMLLYGSAMWWWKKKVGEEMTYSEEDPLEEKTIEDSGE